MAATYPELTQYYGLLAGLIFTIPYTVTGLWTGSLADKVKDPRNRAMIFSLAGIAWSLCTYAGGAIDSPTAFALSRFGLGIFVSFNQPFGFALIQDWFPQSMQGAALSVFNSSIHIGAGIASLNVDVTEAFGWRADYEFMGAFGVVAGLLGLFFLRE